MKIKHYHKATSMADAYEQLKKEGSAIVAGGAWLRLSGRVIETGIDLAGLGLDAISVTEETITIGAMTTLHTIETHPEINRLYDGILVQAIGSVMGVGLRNVVTIGGNIVARHGFSDIITALQVMDVTLCFHEQGETPLKTFLAQKGAFNDILEKIVVRKRKASAYFKKVSKTALDFPVLNIAMSKDQDGYKLAVGARPSIAIRAEKTEKLLNKAKTIDDALIEKVIDTALGEIRFNSNHRGSASYRQSLAKTYIRRALFDLNDGETSRKAGQS